MKAANLRLWERRIERAASLISSRLDDPPSLHELAAAAAVSPYHFHRIWRGMTGETVGETVGRLRIERSTHLLANAGTSVTEAAMDTGFGTPQSFSRAFRKHTGIAPSTFKDSVAVVVSSNLSDADIRIELREGLQVVALRRDGGGYTALNALFGQVWSWAEAVGAIGSLQGIYGIPLDDPAHVDESALRYDACLAIGSAEPPPPPLRIVELPSGPHAVYTHRGSYDGLEEANQRLVGNWLPQSGYEPANEPLYHHFLNDPDAVPEPELITEILLPLAPRDDVK